MNIDENVVFDKSKKYLAQVASDFFFVFNDNELHLFKNTKYIMEKLGWEDSLFVNYIAIVYHNKDVIKEENRAETPHYHVVLSLNKKVKFSTMQDTICDLFHCNSNQIGMQKCTSLCGASRYLCHLDNSDKYPYDMADVLTNDSECFKRYCSLVQVKDLHDLINLVRHYNYELETIMEKISEYDKWRKYINDLIVNHYRRPRIQVSN